MAKKSKKNEKFNYNASVNALKAEEPEVAYGNKYLCRIRTQSLLNREKRCVL